MYPCENEYTTKPIPIATIVRRIPETVPSSNPAEVREKDEWVGAFEQFREVFARLDTLAKAASVS